MRQENSNMPELTKIANCGVRKDGRIDTKYRKEISFYFNKRNTPPLILNPKTFQECENNNKIHKC